METELRVGEEKIKVKELYSERKVQNRIEELAEEIAASYIQNRIWKEGETIAVLAILDGAVFFAADLMRRLGEKFPPESLELETLGITAYHDSIVPGKIKIDKDTKRPLAGKHILIVEDIADTGVTLKEVLSKVRPQGPKSIRVCVLIDKRGRRKEEVEIHHAGFVVERGLWVIGYGLDWKGKGRGLPWIGFK